MTPPRALSAIRRAPRAWTHIIDSVEYGFLTDAATIMRRKTTAAAADAFGTPTTVEQDLGPYAARLHARVANDQRQPDRHVLENRWELTIASDVQPVEGDRISVTTREGVTTLFRVSGTVNHRRAAWGQSPVWNLEVQATEEM